jgi:uncharacterized membrane protein
MGIVLAFLIGFVAGLRSLTAPAIVSWAARLGWLHLEETRLAFMGYPATPYIFTVLALGELVADQLPKTPSRKSPPGFAARALMGALSGASIGAASNAITGGAVAGVLGAVAGTLIGYEARVRAAKSVGQDWPVAVAEDLIAIGLGLWAAMAA